MQERKESDITIDAARAISNRPLFTVRIPMPPETLWQRLKARLGKHPLERVYTVHPIKVGCMLRITEVILRLPKEAVQQTLAEGGQVFLNEYLPIFAAHIDDLVEVIALALTNRDEEPPEALHRAIRREFDNGLVLEVVQLVCRQLHMRDFLTSIVLAKGLSMLPETSREDLTGGIIAPGE